MDSLKNFTLLSFIFFIIITFLNHELSFAQKDEVLPSNQLPSMDDTDFSSDQKEIPERKIGAIPPRPMNPQGFHFSKNKIEEKIKPDNNGESDDSETKKTESTILSPKKKIKFNKSGPENLTSELFPEMIDSFDFQNADLGDVIKLISELTGKNFIVDPNVKGRITIIAPSRITVAEAYRAFLSALAMNGLTVVEADGFLKIKNARLAQRDSKTYSGNYYPNSDQMITKIIQLKHISAPQVTQQLKILPSKDGEIVPYEPTNSLIVSDFGTNVDRIMKIIAQLDIPGFDDKMDVIPIRYASAKEMADLIDRIVNKGEKKPLSSTGGSFSSGFSRYSPPSSRVGFGGSQGQEGNSFFMAIPHDRTNSIIVVGNSAGIERIKKLIGQLDIPKKFEESGNIHVYYVKFGDAEKIAETLRGVTKEVGSKQGSSSNNPSGSSNGLSSLGAPPNQSFEIFGGDIKVLADKGTNSLIVTANKTDYETVHNLLEKLDIARDQVFVEAIIMEMSGSDGYKYETGYYNFPDQGYGKVGFNGGLNLQDLLNPTGGQGAGAILGFGSQKTVEVTNPIDNKTISIPNLVGFITFLKKVTKGNILSTPQVTALDNQEAEIEVGDSVPTSVTSTTQQGVTINTPVFSEATIYLKIKPIINPSNEAVRMEIDQKVAQLSPGIATPKALEDTTQPLQKRHVKTTIVVNNGDTAIIGGLMKDQEIETVSKVPFLGDIPILGWLFKSQSKSKQKINMLVFLTPTIIRSEKENKIIVSHQLDERAQFIAHLDGKDPWGSKIDEIRKRSSEFKNEEKDSLKKNNKEELKVNTEPPSALPDNPPKGP